MQDKLDALIEHIGDNEALLDQLLHVARHGLPVVTGERRDDPWVCEDCGDTSLQVLVWESLNDLPAHHAVASRPILASGFFCPCCGDTDPGIVPESFHKEVA